MSLLWTLAKRFTLRPRRCSNGPRYRSKKHEGDPWGDVVAVVAVVAVVLVAVTDAVVCDVLLAVVVVVLVIVVRVDVVRVDVTATVRDVVAVLKHDSSRK